MKVLIVEDETIASGYLCELLGKVAPDITVEAITESITQTVKWLGANPSPDLIFMDIHLSDGSAFSIFDVIPVETPIIFTTAYDEYAINAFKVNSIDYLLKPVGEEDLRNAVEKFRKLTASQKGEYIRKQSEQVLPGSYYQKLLIAHKDNLVPVPVANISYIYTSDHHTTLCLADGTQYPYNKPLDSIMQGLDPSMFFRANKQFIIAKEHVSNITVWFDRRLLVTLDTGTPERIYINKNRSPEFKEWVMGISAGQ